jgi:VIT1/CCC1 family predicted Fe2+/Mn2+ transporter
VPTELRSLSQEECARSLENLKLERDAITLYDQLARIEKDARRAAAFKTIAGNERRHAAIWADRLRQAGVDVPETQAPRPRVRLIIALARLFGTRAVSDLVKGLEGDEEDVYSAQDSPEVAAIAADEREHAEIWKRLDAGLPGVTEAIADPTAGRGDGRPGTGRPGVAAALSAPAGGRSDALPARSPAGLVRREESWHRAGRTGTLRAAIFGINDGLVSNLSLVMGVAGAAAPNEVIVLSGVAGLLAGAFSMAAGEYISMQSQRELFERQISIEREEMRVMPDTEEAELAEIYRGKGLSTTDARRLAERLMADPEVALDTKVREELGLDPDELGSAWGAAGSSFVSFAVGAAVPLVPFLLTRGAPAMVAALVVASVALFLVGAGVSLLTGRGAMFSGVRQVAIGAVAAAVTFAVGSVIGVQVAG